MNNMEGLMEAHAEALVDQATKNRQQWGGYAPAPAEHLLILAEEVGEVARAMQQRVNDLAYQWPPAYSAEVYRELIDCGAVILAMMEACDAALR